MTALATSSTSARVGIGLSTIDCSICVAVITTLLRGSDSRMIFFCRPGSSASPISTPRSPRATITASRRLDDFGQVLDRLRAFDLGHQRGIAAGGAGDRAGLVHVGGIAAERHRDEVGIDLRGDGDQLAVAFGQRAEREPATEPVQALAVGERAVVEHRGGDALAFDRVHPQLQQSIVQQQGVADPHVIGQAEVADADLVDRARRRIGARDQIEAFAGAQLHPALGELLDADLGTRQVGEDADFDPGALRGFAHRLRARHLRGRVAVREIQADHIDAGSEDGIEHAGRIGGRAEGGEDLGAATMCGHGMLCGWVSAR